jgi:hypothetical protein
MYVHCEVGHNMNFSHYFSKLLLLQFLFPNTYYLLACFFTLLLHFSISQLVSYEKKFKFISWALRNKQYLKYKQTLESHYMFVNIYEFYLVWKFCKLFWVCLNFLLGSSINNGRVFWFIFLWMWWSPNIMQCSTLNCFNKWIDPNPNVSFQLGYYSTIINYPYEFNKFHDFHRCCYY